MKQSQFVAEIQLKYIPSDIKTCDYGKIKTSKDAYHFIYSLYDLDTIGLKETFVVIFLNRAPISLATTSIPVEESMER